MGKNAIIANLLALNLKTVLNIEIFMLNDQKGNYYILKRILWIISITTIHYAHLYFVKF